MEYHGRLYGKVGKSYIPLEATTDDFDVKKEQSDSFYTVRALRKKGTDKWYSYDADDGFFLSPAPDTWEKDDLLITGYAELPKDAELVELEIRVKGVIEQ